MGDTLLNALKNYKKEQEENAKNLTEEEKLDIVREEDKKDSFYYEGGIIE